MTDPPSHDTSTDSELIDATIVEQPRLGIVHLMLWTAGTAVLLSTVAHLRRVESFDGPGGVIITSVWIVWSIITGPAVGSLAIFCWRRRKRIPFPTQPGEWLLLLLGFEAVCMSLFQSIWAFSDGAGATWQLYILGEVLFPLAMAVPYVVAAVFLPSSPAWRWFFAAVACASVAMPLFEIVPYLFGWWPFGEIIYFFGHLLYVVAALPLVVASVQDRRRGVRRGWLHGTGITVFLLQTATGLVYRLAFFLLTFA